MKTSRTLDGDGAVVELHRDAICGIQGAERFDIQEVIASGGQGTVFRARNRETGERVALKVFHQSCIDSQRALKDEFRSLATLRHPGIVQMYELHVGENYAFFTMELVEGSELDTYVRSALPSSAAQASRAQYWSALRLVITQLAIAIQAAHTAGLLHLDIKPGNVRVTELGRVVLLDFGLVRNARQRAGLQERSGGTPPYMAPEQLDGAKVSEKTDWYAFGTVLWQLLSVDGQSPRPPLRRYAPGGRDSSLAPDVPPDLAALCAALSQFDAQARPSGREVLARLGALTPRAGLSHAGSDAVVGRAAELAVLRDVFESHKREHQAHTTLVKLSGAPGVGKTSLLREFVERLTRDEQAHVFSGRCFERAMLPYRLLDELMDQLAEAAWRARIGASDDPDQQALARMFPCFSSGRSDSHEGAAPRPDEVTPRALRAITRILRELAQDGRPLVLWLDDVQWTDLDSVPFLLALLAQNSAPLMVLLSSQAFIPTGPLERGLDELAQSHASVKLFDIELKGLSASAAAALIEQLDPTQLSVKDRIWLQAEGNPLQMAELVRHGCVEALPAEANAPESVPLDQLYIGRVAHLSQGARRLLELAALSNLPVSSNVLIAADGGGADELAALEELRRGAFTAASGDAVELAHDTIRKCVRAYLSSAHRRWAHSALASAHLAHNPNAHEVLAYHFEGAGEIAACIEHLRKGAEASAGALAFVRAATLYERAYELLGDADHEQRGLLRQQQAQSMQSATDAQSIADSLAGPSGGHSDLARTLALRAIELHLLAGHFEETEPALRRLLEEVGLPTFRSEQGALLRGLFELGAMFVHGLPELASPRVSDEHTRFRIEVCQAALRGYSTSATFRGAVYGVILLRLACQAGEAWRIVLASVHVSGFLTFSNLGWAKQYARKLLERAAQLAQGDPELVALAESGKGTPALFTGQWRLAYNKLTPNNAAASFGNRFGPEWILAGQMSLIALDQLGEIAQLREDAQRILENGIQQGNRMITGETRLWLALTSLASERVDEARQLLALAEPCAPKNSFLFVHWCMLRLRVQILLHEGDYRQALLVLRRERRALRASGLLTIQFIRVLVSQLEAVAISGEVTSGRLARRQAEKRLDELAQVAARDEAAYARATHAVIRASAFLVRGRTQSALHELQRADGHYADADMRLHAAAMRLCSRTLSGETEGACPEQWLMQQLGIQAPRRWMRWLTPCAARR